MTTSVTDDRARFEAGFYAEHRKGWTSPADAFWMRDGDYGSLEVRIAYSSWQAALRSQGKVEGWRPIKTAPEGVPCIVGWIDDGDECTEFDTLEEGVWQMHYGGWEHFISVAPPGSRGPSEKAPYTHWMLLPPVPTNDLTAIIGDDTKADISADRNWIAGAQWGFGRGLENDNASLAEAIEARQRDIKAIIGEGG